MGPLYRILEARKNDSATIDLVATLAGFLPEYPSLEKRLREYGTNMEPGFRTRKFFEMVKNDTVEEVKESLAADVHVNARGDMGRIPLMFAAIRGDVAFVELLLGEGVGVDTIDYFGWTASHWAASYSNKGVFDMLSAHGSVVDAT